MARKIRYIDETSVGTVSGNVTTTLVNRLGYKLKRRDLEQILEGTADRPFFYVGHDIDEPPVGKVVKAEIRQLEDGEYGLWEEIELFDEEVARNIQKHGGVSIGLRSGLVKGLD